MSLYDRDLREAGDPASVIDRFERTFELDGSITAELAFFPDPAIRHVIGRSTSIGGQTGSYSVEAVNEGDPVATTLDILPAPIDVRR